MSEPIAKEIKEQILFRIKNEGVSGAQAAKDAGVSSKTVYGWLAKESLDSVSILDLNRLKRENEGLCKIIGKLTLEMDKVKKGKLSR
jgi:transposase